MTSLNRWRWRVAVIGQHLAPKLDDDEITAVACLPPTGVLNVGGPVKSPTKH
jgi:hypothetical protein